MAQFMFAFVATDGRGNRIEGQVSAPDLLNAADQVRQMGYTPQQVKIAASGAASPSVPMLNHLHPANGSPAPYPQPVSPAMQTAPMQAVAASPSVPVRSAPIDLSQPIIEYPVVVNPLLAQSLNDAPETPVQSERLEPWERGGPLAPSLTAQPLNSDNGVNEFAEGAEATQAMTAPVTTGTAAVAPHPYATSGVERRPTVRTPYGRNATRESTPFERFKEIFIYPIRSGVVIKDLAPFYRQFATLINAGLSIHQSLVGLEANTKNSKLKEIAHAGQAQVQAGGRFSDVMAAYPWIFPKMQVEMVRASEQGGMLDTMLNQIAGYVEHDLEIRRLISHETIYPKIVLFMALMILGCHYFVDGMPAIAKLVLGSMGKSEYTTWSYLWDTIGIALMVASPFIIGYIIFRIFFYNVEGIRESIDTFKTNIPGLGKLIRAFVVAKFMRTFASLYRAGFGMSAALMLSAEACGNAVLVRIARRAVPAVENGSLVSDQLARSGFFPPVAVDMFRTGETTGGMDDLLDKLADHYEAEAKLKSHQLALIFATAVFLLVAVLVGFAVISFYMGQAQSVSNA